ncbi:hypothetical protein [uncultured Methylobacterium sp.]|uniref:hypothetical protein n=1 Tax=uncultured Methylobacterium sp. TaxID=157278 RepID=UPI002586A3EA|nr:hypothetical protein [uncultured Methylobacterium sp.]
MTFGAKVKVGGLKSEDAEVLAATIFDGKREPKVRDTTVVTPDWWEMRPAGEIWCR